MGTWVQALTVLHSPPTLRVDEKSVAIAAPLSSYEAVNEMKAAVVSSHRGVELAI